MITYSTAIYTGGNIWLFHGALDDGNYFLTDDDGFTLILNADPSADWDESLYQEWQDAHLVRELFDEERMEFCDEVLDKLTDCPMTDMEIDAYRQWFKSEVY